MNQTLLFLIGTAVFAVTLVGIMLYGYAISNRSYQADIDTRLPDTRPPDTRPPDTGIMRTGNDGTPLMVVAAPPIVSPIAG